MMENDDDTVEHMGFISALVMRSGRGDVAAFGRLFDLLCWVVQQRVATHRPTEQTDDAVREAFVHLWTRSATFVPGGRNGVEWALDEVAAFLVSREATPRLATANLGAT
jgi:hypothetical protein